MPQTLLLFDFDGTIADTLPPILKYINDHRKELGLDHLGDVDVKEIQGMTLGDIIKTYKFNLLKLPFLIRKLRSAQYNLIDEIQTHADLEKVLKDLKKRGYLLAVVTSNSKKNVEKFLQVKGLNMFDFIHSNLNIFGKARTLRAIIKNKKYINSRLIYIGDEVRDIQACREIGMTVISVTWGFNTKELLQKYQPDAIVNKPEELIDAISSLA